MEERDFYQDGKKRISKFLCVSRTNAGMSQEAMALELGVARKTVQNWEKGASMPDIGQIFHWFDVLSVNPMPYFFEFVFPTMEGICGADHGERIREALILLVEQLPEESIRQLMYLFYGDHGSSPRAILNLLTAHLQTPMRDRVTTAGVIVKNYEIAEKKGMLTAIDHVQPNMDILNKALKKGEEAVFNDAASYSMTIED